MHLSSHKRLQYLRHRNSPHSRLGRYPSTIYSSLRTETGIKEAAWQLGKEAGNGFLGPKAPFLGDATGISHSLSWSTEDAYLDLEYNIQSSSSPSPSNCPSNMNLQPQEKRATINDKDQMLAGCVSFEDLEYVWLQHGGDFNSHDVVSFIVCIAKVLPRYTNTPTCQDPLENRSWPVAMKALLEHSEEALIKQISFCSVMELCSVWWSWGQTAHAPKEEVIGRMRNVLCKNLSESAFVKVAGIQDQDLEHDKEYSFHSCPSLSTTSLTLGSRSSLRSLSWLSWGLCRTGCLDSELWQWLHTSLSNLLSLSEMSVDPKDLTSIFYSYAFSGKRLDVNLDQQFAAFFTARMKDLSTQVSDVSQLV